MNERHPLRVWRDLLDELAHAAIHRRDTEQAGLLLGHPPASEHGPTVAGYLDLEPCDGLLPLIAEWQREWARIERRVERMPELHVLGWVWSVPGGRTRLTPEAQLVHRTFFSLPWQVTAIVEPASNDIAFYGRDTSGELANLRIEIAAPVSGAGPRQESPS